MQHQQRWAAGVGAAGLIAGGLPLAVALSSQGHHSGLIIISGPLIGWAFIGTGIIASARRPGNRIGTLMIAVGFAYALSGLIASTQPWIYLLGLLVLPLPYAILFHILLAFPTGELGTRGERLLVWLSYLSAIVAHPVAVLFQDTARQGFPSNPLLVAAERAVVVAIYATRFAVGLALIVGLAVILTRRWRAASSSQQQALAPVYLSGGLVLGLLGIWYVASLARLTGMLDVLELARVVALAVVPFAFLGGLLRSRVVQARAVTRLVAQLGDERDRRRALRDMLAEALGDPTLTLAYWLPERGEYVDGEGRPVQLPEGDSSRSYTPVERHGERIAAVVHDASLAEEPELVHAAGAAASLALENERLDAELHAKLEELRASRARIVTSGDEARRRIERDLHDGAQQRLVSLALTLRLARSRLNEEPERTLEMLEHAGQELDVALGELRELARGIHPAVLSERGLDAALRGLAHRAPVPVELAETVDDGLPKSVEAAAYFVVAEAITNVAKYADASHATVSVQRQNGTVVVEVADDGVGGADPGKGSGLRGLADRISALDGRLEVTSERGRGNTVRATIPCE